MKTLIVRLMMGALLLGGAVAQTVTTDKAVYGPDEAITVSWTGALGNAKDWIGIYPTGRGPGNGSSTVWRYVDGQVAGTTTFDPVPVNGYTVYLLENDGFTVLAGPVNITVENNIPVIGTFRPDHNFVEDGAPITLSWSITPHGQTISSIALSDGVNPAIDVTGQTSYSVSPSATTVYTLDVNAGAATRETKVLKGVENTTAFSLNTTKLTTGNPVIVSWSGATANPDSWVGIYTTEGQVGDTPATVWNYLNGTQGVGGNVPQGEMSFTLPAGDYFACLFVDGKYDIEQGPIRFTVRDEVPPFMITSVELFDEGREVDITWNSPFAGTYTVYGSSDMAGDPETAWSVVKANISPSGPSSRVTDFLTEPLPRRFYRVKWTADAEAE